MQPFVPSVAKDQATTEEVKPTAQRFHELVVMMDDQSWIWSLVSRRLQTHKLAHIRVPSEAPVRQSWDRFLGSPQIIVHWEAKGRSGGALVEEILDVEPSFDVGNRIIVLTTNPTHEDVVYFSELGVRRIIKLRNRDKDLQQSARELDMHLARSLGTQGTSAETFAAEVEEAWRELQHDLDQLPEAPTAEQLADVENRVRALAPDEYTARYLDALATLHMHKKNDAAALKNWQSALDKNPNYYRAYTNLTNFYRRRGRYQDALGLMHKMHELNRQSISRLTGMGEIHMALGDNVRAESFFQSALARDSYASGALNGLAEIRFHQGDLDESRKLLARSQLAYKTAANLNATGIELVKRGKYGDALEHYTKAQYVLPQQDKGPLLFYNIGLCYARWEKFEMAKQFLKIALIKEPGYSKAQKLLGQVETRLQEVEMAS